MVSYRWSFETYPISRMVAEIFCVKHLAKHIRIENVLIPIFGGRIGVVAFLTFGV